MGRFLGKPLLRHHSPSSMRRTDTGESSVRTLRFCCGVCGVPAVITTPARSLSSPSPLLVMLLCLPRPFLTCVAAVEIADDALPGHNKRSGCTTRGVRAKASFPPPQISSAIRYRAICRRSASPNPATWQRSPHSTAGKRCRQTAFPPIAAATVQTKSQGRRSCRCYQYQCPGARYRCRQS